MAKPTRYVEQDLRGGTEIRPVAQPNQSLYLSDAPRIQNFNDIDFTQVAAQLNQGLRIGAGVYKDTKVKEGAEAFALKSAVDANIASVDQKKKWAKMVSDGFILEEQSPYFLIGYRQAAARNAVNEWSAEVEVELENVSNQAFKFENGVPVGVNPAEDLIGKSWQKKWDAMSKTNPALVADGYFAREAAAHQSAAVPRLLHLARKRSIEATKTNHRTLLHGDLQDQMLGLNDGVLDIKPEELSARTKALQATMDKDVRLNSVDDPHLLYAQAAEAAVDRVAMGPGGARAAAEMLKRIGKISIGGVADEAGNYVGGRTAETGKYASTFARMSEALWEKEEHDEVRRIRTFERKRDEAVKAWKIDPKGAFTAILSATDGDEAGIRAEEFRAGFAATGLPAEFRENFIAEANAAAKQVRESSEASSAHELRAMRKDLRAGAYNSAAARLDKMRGEHWAKASNELETYRNVTHGFVTRPEVNRFIRGMEAAIETVQLGTADLTTEHQNEYLQEMDSIIEGIHTTISNTPEDQREAKFDELMKDAASKLKEVRESSAAHATDLAATLKPITDRIRDGVPARAEIEALPVSDNVKAKLLDQDRASQEQFASAFSKVTSKEQVESVMLTRLTSKALLNTPSGGQPTGRVIDRGFIKAVEVSELVGGGLASRWETMTTPFLFTEVERVALAVREAAVTLSESEEGIAQKRRGPLYFSTWLESKVNGLVDTAIRDDLLQTDAGGKPLETIKAEKKAEEAAAEKLAAATTEEQRAAAATAAASEAKMAAATEEERKAAAAADREGNWWAATGAAGAAVRAKRFPQDRHGTPADVAVLLNKRGAIPWDKVIPNLHSYNRPRPIPVSGQMFGGRTLQSLANDGPLDLDTGRRLSAVRVDGVQPFPHSYALDEYMKSTDEYYHPFAVTAIAMWSQNKAWWDLARWNNERVVGDLADRGLTPEQMTDALLAATRYTGFSYKEVLSGKWKFASVELPMKANRIEWQVTPLFKNRAELTQFADEDNPQSRAEMTQLFSALGLQYDAAKPLLDQPSVQAFIYFQSAAVNRSQGTHTTAAPSTVTKRSWGW